MRHCNIRDAQTENTSRNVLCYRCFLVVFLVILEKGDRKVKGPKRYLSLFCWKEDTEKRESRLEGEKENEGKVKQPQTANLVFSDY